MKRVKAVECIVRPLTFARRDLVLPSDFGTCSDQVLQLEQDKWNRESMD